MRVGMNPQKQENTIQLQSYHRVVIVVYIPKMSGYYANVFEVMKLSLESITVTKNASCEITVVNNGSCVEVINYLNQIYSEDKINCLIHHRQNVGKMDALIGAARGAREEFVTLSDVDVLFVEGWQQAVEKIFNSIPDVGLVSPISSKTEYTYSSFSTWSKIFLKKVKFKYEPIPENFEAYNKFLESINWDQETDPNAVWPVIEKNETKAIVGSNHQVLTIKRSLLFEFVPTLPSLTLVGNNSEYNYIDFPVDVANKMRLSTFNNFAFHMGNKVEDWMIEIQNKNLLNNIEKRKTEKIVFKANQKEMHKPNLFFYNLKKKIVKPVFSFFYKK
jgi:hypothetical protein